MSVNSAKSSPLEAVWQSLRALTRFARESAGADGCALLEVDPATKELELRDREGVHWPLPQNLYFRREVVSGDGLTTTSYPLFGEDNISGLVTFAFWATEVEQKKLDVLVRLARLIQAVYHLPRSTARLITKVGSLEVELAAIKISERTLGLLGEGTLFAESIETVVRHVETVLAKRPAETMLQQLLPDLEDRVAERKLVVKAKEVLQRRDGISEEQAYMHLRNRSRASRKRLKEVARELIAVDQSAQLVVRH
jgi:hypothetical protein